MSDIKMSAKAKAGLKANIDRLFQPSASQGGGLVNQELCALFNGAPSGLEVELLSFSCDEQPVNRQRTVGQDIVVVNADSMQQRGTAKIRVEGNEYDVKMHVPVALSFAVTPKQVLIGSTGKITSGNNKDSLWLSLRLPTAPTKEQLLSWVDNEAVVTMGAL
jgi:hypothetical protein